MAVVKVKLDARLVEEATKTLGATSRTETVRSALREIVKLHRFKKLMKKYAGKLTLAGSGW